VFKAFLDINILVDFCDRNRSEHLQAVQLFQHAESGNIDCFISESVLNTTAYIATKIIGKTMTAQFLKDLLEYCLLLPNSNAIYLSGIQNAKNDIEDAVLYQLALNNQMDYFLTNDIKDLHKIEVPSLPVLQAKDLMKLL
jgi:predicted nucleic acid-binding protein